MAELQVQNLPSGWDCRFDKKSGRYYFINHQTKTTTWEDPRAHKGRVVEYIPLQHGSPEFRRNYVYPSQTTPIHAFQAPAHYSPKIYPLQELNNAAKSSPKTSRLQDSTLSNVVNTEEAVAKISAMFTTVSDTHIRLLLKKYMKSIFPKAEEMLILDLLSGNDNNIQQVSEVLKDMGFERRDSTKIAAKADELPKPAEDPALKAVVIQVLKTLEEKKLLVAQLQEKYKDIPEQVITIALESVEYDERRARQILNIMIQEESDKNCDEQQGSTDPVSEVDAAIQSTSVPKSQSRQSLKSLLKTDKSDYSLKDICSFSRVIEAEDTNSMGDTGYRSGNLTSTHGANRGIVKGANHDLLLEDYVKWQGPQPMLHHGAKKTLAKGPNAALLTTRSYQACGPNSTLCKGPKLGLARGSLFSQFKDVVVNGTEVRSK